MDGEKWFNQNQWRECLQTVVGANMYYKVVAGFGPQDGDRWQRYLEWRGLSLSSFDSVDRILRPDLFQPESYEDWQNCVLEGDSPCLVTDLDYAKRVLDRHANGVLVGVETKLEGGYVPKDGFLGFDIIDGYCDVSLVTNWGTDEEGIIGTDVLPNGLIGDLRRALQIRDSLRSEFSEDAHAENCQVWAVYRVGT